MSEKSSDVSLISEALQAMIYGFSKMDNKDRSRNKLALLFINNEMAEVILETLSLS